MTLNTDIPSVTGQRLSEEYAAVRTTFGWTDSELADLARAGVDASFAPAGIRAQLHSDIDAWLTA